MAFNEGIFIQLFWIINILLAGYGINYIRPLAVWRSLLNGKVNILAFASIALIGLVVFIISYFLSSCDVCLQDDSCPNITLVFISISDATGSCFIALAYLHRIRALITVPSYKNIPYIFIIIPIAYTSCDLAYILSIPNLVSLDTANQMYNVLNILLLVNLISMHSTLLYIINFGPLSVKFRKNAQLHEKIFLNLFIFGNNLFALTFNLVVLSNFPLGNVFMVMSWAIDMVFFCRVNEIIVHVVGEAVQATSEISHVGTSVKQFAKASETTNMATSIKQFPKAS